MPDVECRVTLDEGPERGISVAGRARHFIPLWVDPWCRGLGSMITTHMRGGPITSTQRWGFLARGQRRPAPSPDRGQRQGGRRRRRDRSLWLQQRQIDPRHLVPVPTLHRLRRPHSHGDASKGSSARTDRLRHGRRGDGGDTSQDTDPPTSWGRAVLLHLLQQRAQRLHLSRATVELLYPAAVRHGR